MIVSDLNYLESVENNNIEGAGYAYFDEEFSLRVNGQRTADAFVGQYIRVNADEYKTITFDKVVTAYAYV
ncbi:hypothetical protein C7H19_22725 [Aphanothece hegewaldii CCALA 016]|uniref:Uncharacterized protein n=1 Tax=Aphanothece hegewaldii CCALA 016 TaxID=2107694 RepID=A0A2T1LRN9_9CHRO|nr:hypothetical protein [Aphanothece hegewaldii]PSF31395.1 hypothetical protein C7H19_22725 [Aphanothece hegewaldii CCALA 016]